MIPRNSTFDAAPLMVTDLLTWRTDDPSSAPIIEFDNKVIHGTTVPLLLTSDTYNVARLARGAFGGGARTSNRQQPCPHN